MKHSQYANNLLSIKSGEDSLRGNFTFKQVIIRRVGPLFWLLCRTKADVQRYVCQDVVMKRLLLIYSIIHGCLAVIFACASLVLVVIATKQGWVALSGGLNQLSAQQIIEAIGLLAVAVVALQISQTIVEEEVLRDAHVSGPTRIRRFLSRFLLVVVVAVAIEGLVATFRASHQDSVQLLYAASILVSAGVLLAGWGVFIRLNRFAEDIEPEAMAEAKAEDKKLK